MQITRFAPAWALALSVGGFYATALATSVPAGAQMPYGCSSGSSNECHKYTDYVRCLEWSPESFTIGTKLGTEGRTCLRYETVTYIFYWPATSGGGGGGTGGGGGGTGGGTGGGGDGSGYDGECGDPDLWSDDGDGCDRDSQNMS